MIRLHVNSSVTFVRDYHQQIKRSDIELRRVMSPCRTQTTTTAAKKNSLQPIAKQKKTTTMTRRLFLCACIVHAVVGFAPPPSRMPSSPLLTKGTTSSKATNPSIGGVRLGQSAQFAFKLPTKGIELAGLVYDSTSTAFDGWEWTSNMGAPAALVAGAVLVTLMESREDIAPRKADGNKVRFLKQSMRLLLLSSFVLEVVSIFVGTMTGSVLLSHGEQAVASKMVGYGSPLQLLFHHHELEYLTTQICFIQGLFNWLAAVAIELWLPKDRETNSAKQMNKCLASWLLSMIVWMLAFYNNHLSFYSDLLHMYRRSFQLFVKDYIFSKTFRPLSLFYGPLFTFSCYLTWKAFRSPPEEDDE